MAGVLREFEPNHKNLHKTLAFLILCAYNGSTFSKQPNGKNIMSTTAQNKARATWVTKGNFAIVKDLLQVDGDAKTTLGNSLNVMTGILYLTPAAQNHYGVNLCPMAGLAECEGPCLNTAGRGEMEDVQVKRLSKTHWFITERDHFMETLAANIERLIRRAMKTGKRLAIRLNGTSDILWERIPVRGAANIMELFPDVTFYDYTKRPNRKVPANYDITFSYSGANERYSEIAMGQLEKGFNVAVVLRSEEKLEATKSFRGIPVFNAALTDCRFLDPKSDRGMIAGLCAKGSAKKDTSGFVVDC